MKAPVLLTAALVASALLLAELCRPGAAELALMFLKDENYTEAHRFAQQVADSGDTSATAMSVRITFLVETGDVEGAIGLLERFLHQHPDDLAGHQLLAQLYGDAQRPNDRLRELRALDRETPDSEQLRELAVDFAAQGAWEARREVLSDLVRQPDARPADFIELAQLDAAMKHLPEALRVLDLLRKRYPDSYDDDLVRFHDAIETDVQTARLANRDPSSTIASVMQEPRNEARFEVQARGIDHRTSRPGLGILRLRRGAWKSWGGRAGRCDADVHAHAGSAPLKALEKAPDDEARAAIIDKLDRAGASATALTALERLSDRDPDTWLSSYVEHAKVSGTQARMAKFLATRAANKVLARARREAFAYVLLDQGVSSDSLHALASLAADFGGDWEDAYTEALAKLHRDSELRAHLVASSSKPDASPDARRAVAWRLLELGAKEDAEQVFRQLAAAEHADGSDVEVLLNLWGPRPLPQQLAWLQSRASAAPEEDRGAWMRRLTAAGAPDRAIAVFQSAAQTAEAMRLARLEALAALGNVGVLRAAFSAEFDRSAQIADSTARASALHQLGDFARDADLAVESERAYGAWAALDQQNATACRSYALAALAAGHPVLADEQLSRCRLLAPPDFQTAVAAGDAALARSDRSRAQLWYARALQLSETHPSEEPSQQADRARALEHVGRFSEADQIYRQIASRNPADLGLRADWAEMLLNAGLPQRAYDVAAGVERGAR